MKYFVEEHRDGVTTGFSIFESLGDAVEFCLEEAWSNGYIQDDTETQELQSLLMCDRQYQDGDYTIEIVSY